MDIPEKVARALKREPDWYIDRETQTIHYTGEQGKITVMEFYRYIQGQLDNTPSKDDLLDITDTVPMIRAWRDVQMINGWSVDDETYDNLEDPENLVR